MLSCGFGEGYALGHNENSTICEFKPISTLGNSKVEKIACGLAHSGCIVDGKPYLWGIALGNRESIRIPT